MTTQHQALPETLAALAAERFHQPAGPSASTATTHGTT